MENEVPQLIKSVAVLDADKVIEIMSRDSNRGCLYGVLNIYWLVYANYLLLNQGGWGDKQTIVDKCLERCNKILSFFEANFPIPRDKDLSFMEWAQNFGPSYAVDIDDCVFTTRDVLIKAGFRDVDMDLYVACEQFDLPKVRLLMSNGANPDVDFPCEISEDDLPLPEDYVDALEVDSVGLWVKEWACGFVDEDFGMDYWSAAASGTQIVVPKSYIPDLCKSAAYQVLYNALYPNKYNN